MNKKALVTIFIIVGIVILLGTATYLIIKQNNAQSALTTLIESEKVPEWAQPVDDYVTECMQNVGLEAVKKLGLHGGYTEPSNPTFIGRTFIASSDYTESQIIGLEPGEFTIPYWFYLETSNTCTNCHVTEDIPSIGYMVAQLDLYIQTNVMECISGLDVFDDMDITYTPALINTIIGDKDMTIQMNMPITIKNQDLETEKQFFATKLDIDFLTTYQLALEIIQQQINKQDFDKNLANKIAMSSLSKPSASKLPPIYYIENDEPAYTTWGFQAVKQKIQKETIPRAMFKSISKTRSSGGQTLDFLSQSYSNHKVRYYYNPNWNIFFDITPNNNGLIMPFADVTTYPFNMEPPKYTNYYEFFYDVSYPVAVIIEDDQAFKNTNDPGFTFRFAFESSIRDNRDLLTWNQGGGTTGPATFQGQAIQYPLTSVEYGQVTPNDDNTFFCSLDGKTYDDALEASENCIERTTTIVTQKLGVNSLFCNPNQRLGSKINITTYDNRLTSVLPEATIKYGCGYYRECYLDTTDEKGSLTIKLPVCQGDGYLYISKEGYQPVLIPHVSSEPDKKEEFKAHLNKIKEIEIEVKTIQSSLLEQLQSQDALDEDKIRLIKLSATPLTSSENAIITYIKALGEYEQIIPGASTTQAKLNDPGKATLAPGMYTLRIQLMDDSGSEIPAQTITADTQSIQLPAIPTAFSGGLVTTWPVKVEDLESSNKVTLYVVKFKTPTTIEEMASSYENLYNQEYYEEYKNFLEPDFIANAPNSD